MLETKPLVLKLIDEYKAAGPGGPVPPTSVVSSSLTRGDLDNLRTFFTENLQNEIRARQRANLDIYTLLNSEIGLRQKRDAKQAAMYRRLRLYGMSFTATAAMALFVTAIVFLFS